jgi:hypothetical protein
MGTDDQREHIEFYGIFTDDWDVSFGDFTNHQYLLVEEYISKGCKTTDGSEASVTREFLYEHHIKKTCYIEGIIEGHITFAASSCTASITNYRVTVCKIHEDNTRTELATTGWRAVNDTLIWDSDLSVGEEIVYHFNIQVLEERKITENERIYLKVETTSDSCCSLYHSNDATWEDIWIDIPFRM